MNTQKPGKETVYKWIRVGGLLALIPITLCVGPIAGYIAGNWLVKEFALPPWVLAACVLSGLSGGILETINIIRAAIRCLNIK